MIDPRLLRDDLDATAAALARRGYSRDDVDGLVDLDARRRELIAAVDAARAEQKEASKAIGQASPDERPALIERASERRTSAADFV